jgi:hypothetical protein
MMSRIPLIENFIFALEQLTNPDQLCKVSIIIFGCLEILYLYFKGLLDNTNDTA